MTNNFLYSDGRLSIKLIALVNIALSLWIITFDPVLNKDAITYLLAAEAYIESGITASLEVYSWPFFHVLFATIHQITFIPLHLAALLVVSVGFFLTSYAFVRIVAEMGGSSRAQLFGLIIITFHPLIADYRSSIIRDSGMWAFMLLAMLELLRYSKNPTKLHQCKWIIYIGVAFLFRIEAMAIALLSPLSLLATGQNHLKERMTATLRFYVPLFFAAGIIGVALLSITEDFGTQLKVLGDMQFYTGHLSQLSTIIDSNSSILSSSMISFSAQEDAGYAVIAVFFTICFINILRAITPIYLIALISSRFSTLKAFICANANAIIKMHLLIIGSYLFLFTISRQFNLERYSFQFVIIILLYLPFIIEGIWRSTRLQRAYRIISIFILAGYALDAVINSDYKKNYINEAAIWLKTETPIDAKIISNHYHIAYFSGKQENIKRELLNKYDDNEKAWGKGITYVFHAKSRNADSLRKRIKTRKTNKIKEFRGKDGGVVIIFKLT